MRSGPDRATFDRQSPITTFERPYTLRAFRNAEQKELAFGVVHSHPRGAHTFPSKLDDDMDAYFAEELSVYSGGMPYCSLIFQRDEGGRFSFTGRLRDGEAWLPVREMLTVGYPLLREVAEDYRREDLPEVDDPNAGRESVTARIASLAGAQAQRRLADATVGVIG